MLDKVKKSDVVNRPCRYSDVKVTKMGNVVDITYLQRKNAECTICKIDSDHYVDLRTGELKEFEHNTSRADDLNFVRVSMRNLREIINTNVTDPDTVRWITLTYAENMTDTTRLYENFKNFFKRLRYHYSDYQLEYIVAMEPQARGAWHAHLLLLFDKKAPFIPNNVLSKIWGHGFVKVKSLKDVDNVGAYLTAYLCDMELDEANNAGVFNGIGKCKIADTVDDEGKNVSKAFIKGARLHLYPPKFNLYRCSKGIKKPESISMPYDEALKSVDGLEPTYENSFIIVDNNNEICNEVYKASYNKKRKNNGKD